MVYYITVHISSDFEDVSDSTSYAVAAALLHSFTCELTLLRYHFSARKTVENGFAKTPKTP